MAPQTGAGAMENPEFPAFPFTPYPIQLQFMTSVYRALQKGGVAIVESPTGIPLFPFLMRKNETVWSCSGA